MKKGLTSINIVLDMSGSMESLTSDTIGGVNNFLKEQAALPGDATVTLCIFNTNSKFVHENVPLASVPMLTTTSYRPSGGTALLDAMGLTIDKVGKSLADMKEEDRPEKVIFLVITDGEENSSHLTEEVDVPTKVTHPFAKGGFTQGKVVPGKVLKYPLDKIKDMVSHQRTKYSWEFMYFGANVDAFGEAQSLGITKSASYNATVAGTRHLYDSISKSVESFRKS